ncbi:MAG TPA: TIGR03118 family protein [Candidatus Acidoferrum sp.]|nr:TIGR03118 family protein [Candidatus Acidoferrum sp.]
MRTNKKGMDCASLVVATMLFLCASAQRAQADGANSFTQTNLVSDIPGMAKTPDPNLVNPWGVSFSPTSPFWISDNGTGLATLYDGAGDIIPLVVAVPPPGSAPTGQVFNSSSSFNGDLFIFATEGGTITGWRGALGTTAETLSPGTGGVYKGLAIATTPNGTYLYATDFHNNSITVFPGTGAPSLSGTFTDPNLPAGYAPFNIQTIGGKLYVTYAVQDAAKHDDVSGPGHGIVDVFDLQGNFLQRLISNGPLNSPWGMAIAPTGFGSFGNDLLVGNFGDGTINAFDPSTGNFLGQLDGANGMPLVNLGLWDLTFGNGGNGGSKSDLFFTAGIPGDGMVEDHGLFGSIVPTPEPGTFALLGSGLLALIGTVRRRKNAAIA